jgi:murein endopeptidase
VRVPRPLAQLPVWLAACALTLAGALPAGAQEPTGPVPDCRIDAAHLTAGSRAVGLPHRGRLVRGVLFPAASSSSFTWDFPLARTPSRSWRRWGTERLVRTLQCVLEADELAHPFGARVGVADLSRPAGGPFGRRYGGLGHASHQNGLDVDVLYPHRDDCDCPADRAGQIDTRRSQALVDAFVAAGARYVFVSPELWRRGLLRGPRRIVQPLIHHEQHMHVRLRP